MLVAVNSAMTYLQNASLIRVVKNEGVYQFYYGNIAKLPVSNST